LAPIAAPGHPNEHCPNSAEQAAISNALIDTFSDKLTTSALDLKLLASAANYVRGKRDGTNGNASRCQMLWVACCLLEGHAWFVSVP